MQKLCDEFNFPFGSIKKQLTSLEGCQPKVVPKVFIGKIWRGQKKQDMPTFPEGFLGLKVYVCNGKGYIGNQLSPFNLSVPTNRFNGNEGQQSLELVWQASKVKEDEVTYEHAVDGKVILAKASEQYFQRRAGIYNKAKPRRRYFKGRVAGAVFGNNANLIGYVDSRKWYCTAYAEAVQKTRAFKFLCALRDAGFNLLLMGPDGHPLTEGSSWLDAYEDPSKPFGHERVLGCMLENKHDPLLWPWNQVV